MNGTSFTGKLANFSARRRWAMLGAWLVILVAAFIGAGSIGDVTTSDDGSSGSKLESAQARALVAQRISTDENSKEYVIVEFESGTAANSTNKAFVRTLTADLVALEHVEGVVSYLDDVEGLLSSDESFALLQTGLTVEDSEAGDIIAPLLAVVETANETAGFRVNTIGQGSVETEFNHLAEETLQKGEMIGMGFALIVLLVVFGAAVAAGLPILLAISSILVAIALSAVIGRVMDLDQFVVQIITMIGLAVGIDYSLFIVKRFTEEVSKGRDKIAAITASGDTAGRTVMVSGIAVMIALSGMLIVPGLTFRSFGLGAIVVVIAAVFAATTLLPAIMSILGHRMYWLRLPFIGRKLEDVSEDKNEGGVWDKITNAVTARPVVSVVVTGGALLGLTALAFTMNLGSTGLGSLQDDSPSLRAFNIMNSEFSDGLLTADIVIDTADASSPAVQAAIESLKADLATDSFYGDTKVKIAPNNDLAIVQAVIQGDPASDEALAALLRLRNDYVPSAFTGVASVYVAGDSAMTVDNVDEMKKWLPIVFGLVLSSSFVLLLVVFRSIVVPIKAVLMNVLSVGAAYGLLVLVFQQGLGADLLGFKQTPVIEHWLPLFLFSILFGLSMDYHVFLLSRIKEHYDQTGDNKASVAFGLRSTAGIITGAALIMVGVFGGFAIGDMSMFQQMGFGLAAAVIIDATLVRSVLVPASMVLLGDKNWYFPSWLEWLPRLDVEGESVDAVDTPTAQPTGVLVPSGASD
ncbi:MAG: MMPL family transporter [Chloroflexi bacterium]|nr:MMPL family transporter [Chloroflexota bacterium]